MLTTSYGYIRYLINVILFLFLSIHALAVQTEPTGVVSGRVLDKSTELAIQGATVRVVGTSIGTYTSSKGLFTLKNVPAGIRELKITALGFDSAVVGNIVVSTGKPAEVSIRLQPTAVLLNEAVVVADAFRSDVQLVTSTNSLSSEEVRRAPGVQEDVVRAIALLPGVAVTAAGRNDLAVRGGAPFENLFLVDNIEVPNINHFGSQGSTGGPLSLINIDLVEDVSLSTGGFGPRFGDKLSSVTSLSLRNGNRERLSGEANLSTTGFSLIGEGPIGENATFLVAARRSYLDLIFNLAGFGFIPEYWDFAGKLSIDLNSYNKISFLTIGALDNVRFNNTEDNLYSNSRVIAPSQNQYFSGLTWKHLFETGFLTVTLGRAYTVYRSIQQDSLGSVVFKANTEEGDNSLRADLVLFPSANVELTTGFIARYASTLAYDIALPGFARLDSVGIPSPLLTDTTFSALRYGAHAQASWQFTDRWKVFMGGRVDVYGFLNNAFRFSPRGGISYSPDQVHTLSLSAGTYFQAPQFIWLIGDPLNSTTLLPMRADMAVASWQWIARDDIKFQVEVYGKLYSNYPLRLFRPTAVLAPSGFDDINQDIPFGLEPLSNNASGRSYGVEVFIQKKLTADSPVYGLLSVTFNRTEFIAADGVYRAGRFDTPFIGTLALGWRPNDYWEISGKTRTSVGLPITPFITTAERAAETGFPIGTPDFALYNQGGRFPFFYAIDLRVDRRWFFSGLQLITYIDVQNVTGNQAVSNYQYNPRTGRVETQTSIGVLPSIGINVEF